MTRDMDLVRSILLAMEKHPAGVAPSQLHIEGYDEDTIGHHVYLMGQGELLEVAIMTSQQDPPTAIPLSISWKGHEFLAAAREPAAWNRAKALAQKAGNSSFTVLMQALTKAALDQMP